jgi:sigma-E factor negative regulatory protein RseC
MSASENISHPGVVESIADDTVFVKIVAMSACSACHAKGMCNVSEMEEKVVEIKKDPQRNYIPGENVTVSMRKTLGSKAVFLGYILPFLLMIGVLILVLFLSGDEGIAGLSAIIILVPYYWLLFLYRNNLKKAFSFRID